MKLNFKKLILPASAFTLASPIALVSCVNPFKEDEQIAKAKYLDQNNNLFEGKSIEEFDKLFLKEKYSKNPDYANYLSVLHKTFEDFKLQKFIALERFYSKFSLSLRIDRDVQDVKTKQTIKVVLPNDITNNFIYYLTKNTPFQHNFLSVKNTELYNSNNWGNNSTININAMENYTDSALNKKVSIGGILPKIAFSPIFSDSTLSNSKTETNLYSFYKKIISLLKVLIKEYDANNEYAIQETIAPLYYLVRTANPKEYVDESYGISGKGDTSAFKDKNLLPKNAVESFSKDPVKFINDNKNIVNPFWLSNKTWQAQFKEAVDKSGKIGKFGLAYLVAFLFYYATPNNVEILQFKQLNETTEEAKFLVQYQIGKQMYLFDPVKDFTTVNDINSSNYQLAYKTKEELKANKITFDQNAYLVDEIGQAWK
ncbi:hypothetical protein [Mycoplasmopsis felifaucium]|uniref:Lipoprotein n=1 Tax=Mycoplasmopsis felifaucium TaxID=35768 RepID=A0ABZ2RRQ0_9BACT